MARASALVAEASHHQGPCGVVGCAAWSLAAAWGQALARRRQAWRSLLQTNRRLETASCPRRDAQGWTLKLPGPHLAVEALVPLSPGPAYRPVTVSAQPAWGCTLAVRLPGWGKVRIGVRVETEPLTGRAVVRVTNRVDWSAAQRSGWYLPRGPPDTFDQDRQGPLGFTAYRRRSAEALGKPWCLVFVADSRLPRTCLPAVPARTQGLIHTRGDACRQQGRALRQRLLSVVHDRLSHGARVDQVVDQVLAKQRGMVPVSASGGIPHHNSRVLY
jgi:hypothetical protein